ncbi:MAG: endolytic transglycosylase MltG, partial [Xanthomonadales bacterium]|nr:endolytic transglycosylase MltG [Xanthomonadales bacterium]
MKRLWPVVLVLLLITAALATGVWQQYRLFTNTPLELDPQGMVLTVHAGDSLSAVLARLEKQEVTRLDWRWRVLNRLHGVTIKTGEYLLPRGTTPPGLLDLLASGKVIAYRFTIIEGWSVKQLYAALAADPVLKHTLTDIAGIE